MYMFILFYLQLGSFMQGDSNHGSAMTGSMTIEGLEVPTCNYTSCVNVNRCNSHNSSDPEATFPCFCDSSCLLYGDCCYDYFPVCLGKDLGPVSDTLNLQAKHHESGQSLVNERHQRMLQHKECRKRGYQMVDYWFVTLCPRGENVSAEEIKMCENNTESILGKVSVTLKDNPTITFWNYHCARCHGLQRKDVRFWNTSADCKKTSVSGPDINQLLLKKVCKLIININVDDHPRLCTGLNTKLFNPIDVPLYPDIDIAVRNRSQILCSLYTYPVQDGGNHTYRNPHCAFLINGPSVTHYSFRCHLNPPTEHIKNLPGQIVGGHIVIDHFITPASTVGSLRILFNFGMTEMTYQINNRTVRAETKSCPMEDEVYVVYTERCEKLICDDQDKRPVNGTCRLKEKVIVNGTGQIYPQGTSMFVFSLRVDGQKNIVKNMEQEIRQVLTSQLNGSQMDTGENIEHVFIKAISNYQIEPSNASDCSGRAGFAAYGYNVLIQSTLPVKTLYQKVINIYRSLSSCEKRHNLHLRYLSLKNFQSFRFSLEFTIDNYSETMSSFNYSVCSNDQTPKVFPNVDVVLKGNNIYAKLNVTYYSLDNIVFQVKVEGEEFLSNVTDIVVCIPSESNETLHCSQGKLYINQTQFRIENETLILLHKEERFKPDVFSLADNGAFICYQHALPTIIYWVGFFKYNRVQNILTILTTTISMFSLFIVLLIYGTLPELRNIPGKIVMSLSLTLLLGQGLQLLITVPTGRMCVALAFLAHTTWLSTFLWMTLLSVDLARSLRSMSSVTGVESPGRLYCLYACLAWVLPTLFVTSCFLTDHFNVLGIVIGYGSDHLCWITNRMASLYVFGLPVVLTLVINCICFTMTLVNIESTSRKVATMTFKSEKTRLWIYVRLLLIMGLSWTLNFAAAFTGSEILWYCPIVLNGLQGFAIFVCFICKSRIKKLLLKKKQRMSKYILSSDTLTVGTDRNHFA